MSLLVCLVLSAPFLKHVVLSSYKCRIKIPEAIATISESSADGLNIACLPSKRQFSKFSRGSDMFFSGALWGDIERCLNEPQQPLFPGMPFTQWHLPSKTWNHSINSFRPGDTPSDFHRNLLPDCLQLRLIEMSNTHQCGNIYLVVTSPTILTRPQNHRAATRYRIPILSGVLLALSVPRDGSLNPARPSSQELSLPLSDNRASPALLGWSPLSSQTTLAYLVLSLLLAWATAERPLLSEIRHTLSLGILLPIHNESMNCNWYFQRMVEYEYETDLISKQLWYLHFANNYQDGSPIPIILKAGF
ncbi:uncharacterized protein CLUP02_15979 [Colletotrichum lupini]|uniref:Uncharacterized protein n=1 Tax=Colletotrichum lupini TaxID=145971 RepID=A0A9Q8T6Y7_9PEZI|nr:uncharacterized protein CLUP02_15979 [Colletotrichum lupini]UQC90449.1 hypothetical protein CLUP02_15979 [Colletotrichum lupini]